MHQTQYIPISPRTPWNKGKHRTTSPAQKAGKLVYPYSLTISQKSSRSRSFQFGYR